MVPADQLAELLWAPDPPPTAPVVTEMRLQARELRIEANLRLARHAEAVIKLLQLIAAHPVRERLYALLMVAYYRCGRRAEALDTSALDPALAHWRFVFERAAVPRRWRFVPAAPPRSTSVGCSASAAARRSGSPRGRGKSADADSSSVGCRPVVSGV